MFREWQYYRATKSQTSDEMCVEIQSVDTPFEEFNAGSMAYWLGKFVQETVKKDGQRYQERSVYGLLAALKRHLD